MFSSDNISVLSTSPTYLVAYFIFVFGLVRAISYVINYWSSFVTRKSGENKSIPLPPGDMGYPVIGETFHFFLKGGQFYHQKMLKHGNIYKTHLFGNPTIRVIGAEHVKKIVLGENDTVTQLWPTSTRLLLGKGSITQSSGITNRVRRKHMLTALNTNALSDFVPVLQEKIYRALETWCQKRDILGYTECKQMAFRAAARIMLGLEVESAKGKEISMLFLDFLNNIFSIPFDLPGFGFHKGFRARERIIKELQSLIEQNMKNGSLMPTPVMDSYSEMCTRLGTDDELAVSEGMLDLVFTGHETITTVMTNSLMLLGKHKEVIEKLRQELADNNIVCDGKHSNDDLSYMKIGKLKYVDYVVKEVLRLYPPSGGGFRKVLRDFELGGYLIPKDWTLIYSIRETHQTSPIFEKSDLFLPERWEKLDEKRGQDRFHFIPFGAGARDCIGRHYAMLITKIFIIELVRKCDWTLKNPNPTMRLIPIPVPSDYLPLTITRR